MCTLYAENVQTDGYVHQCEWAESYPEDFSHSQPLSYDTGFIPDAWCAETAGLTSSLSLFCTQIALASYLAEPVPQSDVPLKTKMCSPLLVPLTGTEELLPEMDLLDGEVADAPDAECTMVGHTSESPPGQLLTQAASTGSAHHVGSQHPQRIGATSVLPRLTETPTPPKTTAIPVQVSCTLSPPNHAPPGMSVAPAKIAGATCTRVDWRIDDFCGRLQACLVRPLVSLPFSACGLPNLRLMVVPDARGVVKSARCRDRKGLYTNMIRKGPMYASFKLKTDCLAQATVLRFCLTVGSTRRGPFTNDFSEQAIHGCDDFDVNWLNYVDPRTGVLSAGLEILEVRPREVGSHQSCRVVCPQ